MQAVLFHVGDDRYALDARRVAEIVPSIPLRRVPGTPDHVAGLMDYRGVIVPVVDLSVYLGHPPCAPHLSSRILVCDIAHDTASMRHEHEAEALVGVMAERVLRVAAVETAGDGTHAGPASRDDEVLGRLSADEEGLLQIVEVQDLLPPALIRTLVREGAAEGA